MLKSLKICVIFHKEDIGTVQMRRSRLLKMHSGIISYNDVKTFEKFFNISSNPGPYSFILFIYLANIMMYLQTTAQKMGFGHIY